MFQPSLRMIAELGSRALKMSLRDMNLDIVGLLETDLHVRVPRRCACFNPDFEDFTSGRRLGIVICELVTAKYIMSNSDRVFFPEQDLS